MQTDEGGNNKVVMDAVAAPPSASNVAAPAASAPADANAATATAAAPVAPPPRKKKPKKRNKESTNDDQQPRKKPKTKRRATTAAASQDLPGLSAAQLAVNEQMRRALEEDQYSALGSIVEDDDSDDEQEDEHAYLYRGQPVRLDRAALITAVRKHNLLERLGALGKPVLPVDDEEEEEDEDDNDGDDENIAETDEADKVSSKKTTAAAAAANAATRTVASSVKDVTEHEAKDKSSSIGVDPLGFDLGQEDDLDRDGGSIFGQTTGAGNSTWVECDKCKKWRRLRGVVDEKKLPSKWYCSMNKNDPERARCSAPEEEYEASHTPESAADARTRKHLRVWVRRLQCNEAYEARQPTLTRGKKRAAASSSKDPYEWVRCCNPSCGKWRAILRIMDAKGNVIDRTKDGEWYCVMNTWDEKIASCAAPQENLPAVGCPPWVMQDE